MTDVVQADLQGNILCGYGRDYRHGLFLFLRVEDPARVRAWLSERVSQVTSALPWSKPPAHTLNVAFSFAGLRALGVPEQVLDRFPEAFREGMAARWVALGDTGPSHPYCWMPGLRRLDLVVTVNARESSVRGARRAELEAEAAEAGLEQVERHEQQRPLEQPLG